MGPGDRHSAALSAERKTRMGQQGCWHKGMPGQGCPVTARSERSTSGAKAPRHARREDRQAPGPTRWRHPRPVQHRAPPVGDTPGLCSTGPHPLATPQACAAPGSTRWRHPRSVQHRAPPVGDTPGLCSTGHHPQATPQACATPGTTRWRHPRPVQHQAQPAGDGTESMPHRHCRYIIYDYASPTRFFPDAFAL